MQDEYIFLFNQVTDTITALQELQIKLILAQQKAEEIYMDKNDN